MRTDLKSLFAAALLSAALAAGPAASAAQDTVLAPAAPGAEPVRSADRVAVNGDLVIPAHETVEGRVVVMKGDLRLAGRVTGDVTVAAGSLTLEPGAQVGGDVAVNGGTLQNLGTIAGDAHVQGGKLVNSGQILGEMRVEGTRSERAAATAAAAPRTGATAAARMNGSWMRSFGAGLQGLLSVLGLGVVLAAMGAASVFYGLPRLQAVSDSLRRDPGHAALGGLAAAVLTVPLFLVLIFALVVTIIGIPLLLVAVPLYPVLVAAAAGLGVVAAAHALGERTAEQRGSTEPRHRNAYSYVFTGLALLLAPAAIANVLQMTGLLGWLAAILEFFAWGLVWAAAIVGVGALVLTRGGRLRPTRHEYDPILDGDPGFEPEPVGGPHA